MLTKGIDINGSLYNFKPLNNILLFNDNLKLTQLKLNESLKEIYCQNNLLTELNIPEGVNIICCYDNKFNRNLVLPQSIEYCSCDSKVLDNINKYKHLEEIYIHY